MEIKHIASSIFVTRLESRGCDLQLIFVLNSFKIYLNFTVTNRKVFINFTGVYFFTLTLSES